MFLVVSPVNPFGVNGKYPGYCGQMNSENIKIRYRDGRMTTPSKPFPLPTMSQWTDPAFFKFILDLMDAVICWFPFNFGMKEIRNEYLMSVYYPWR